MKRYVAEYSKQAVLLVVALAFLFPGTFLRGEITIPGELIYKYPPWSSNVPEGAEIPANWLTQDAMSALNAFYFIADRTMDDGEWPLWNHQQFMGTPMLANYQTAVVYPPKLVFRVFDFFTALTVFVLLKFFLCGLNAYICGRGLGLTVWASRFLSFGWMLCLYNVTWCYWPLPDLSAWLPLMLLGVDFIATGRLRRGFALFVASATPLMLAGHPETALTMASFLGLYFVLRVAGNRERMAGKLAVIAAAWALVLGISAVQILPFIEYLPNSITLENRPKSDEGIIYSLPASTAIVFWIPRFFGMMSDNNYWVELPLNSNYSAMFYAGITAWVAAFAALLTANRWRLICIGVPGVISLLLVFDSPLAWVVKSLPLLNATRSGYFAGFGVFAVLMLGAMGVDAWSRQPSSAARAKWLLAFLIVTVLSPVAFFMVHINGILESDVANYVAIQSAIAVVIAIAAVALFLSSERLGTLAPAGLALLLAADLLVASRGIVPTNPRDTLFPDTPLTAQALTLEKPARVRILPMFAPVIPPGFVVPYGIEQFHGYDAIVPSRFMRFVSLMASPNWDSMSRVCGVEQIWAREGDPLDITNADLVTTSGGIAVYRQPEALGRAFLVGRARAIADRRALLDAMSDPAYDPSEEILADRLPDGDLPDAESVSGKARVVEHRANNVTIEVNATEACFLVLADSYFPGWQAKVNGESTEVFPAYYAFRGVIVPAGESVVAFSYEPWSFRFGLIVSFVSLGVSFVAIGWSFYARNRK